MPQSTPLDVSAEPHGTHFAPPWWFGLADTAAGRLLKRRASILMYHRFSFQPTPRTLDSQRLREQLDYIKQHCNPISIDQMVEAYQHRRPLPKRSVVVTVDDGYEDFYHFAWPIFREFEIPVVLYVTTEFAAQQIWLWPDKIRYLFQQASSESLVFKWHGSQLPLSLSTPVEREAAWHQIADHCLTLRDKEKHQLIGSLAKKLAVELPKRPVADFRGCNWHQLKQMQQEGLLVGVHTCTHPRLTSLTPEQQRAEIEGSKLEAQAKLGVEIRHFCYPNGGRSDYDANTLALVKQAGFASSVVAFHDGAGPEQHGFELRRIGVDDHWLHFAEAAHGIVELKALLKNWLPEPWVQRLKKLKGAAS